METFTSTNKLTLNPEGWKCLIRGSEAFTQREKDILLDRFDGDSLDMVVSQNPDLFKSRLDARTFEVNAMASMRREFGAS